MSPQFLGEFAKVNRAVVFRRWTCCARTGPCVKEDAPNAASNKGMRRSEGSARGLRGK
jgi:hypothetical protein